MDSLIDDLLFQQFNEDDFFVMNIDDFLAENDLQKEKFGNALKVKKKTIGFGQNFKKLWRREEFKKKQMVLGRIKKQ